MFKFLLFLTSFFCILFGTTLSMFEELPPNKMRRNNTIGASGTALSAWPSFTGAAVKKNASTGTTGTERVRTGTTGTERVRTGTTGTERVRTGTTGTERVWTGTTGTERVRTGTTGTERVWTGTTGTERVRSGTTGTERVRTGTTGTERVRTGTTGTASVRYGANKPTTINQMMQQPLSPLHAYFPYNSKPNSPMYQAPRVTNFDGCIPDGFKNLLLRSKSTVDGRNKNGANFSVESLRKCNTYPSESKKFASDSKEKQNNEDSEQKQSKEDKNSPKKLKKWFSLWRKGNKNIPKSEEDKAKAKPRRKWFNSAENKAENIPNIEESEFSFPSPVVITAPETMTPLRLFGSANSSGRKPELSEITQIEQNDGQRDEIVM